MNQTEIMSALSGSGDNRHGALGRWGTSVYIIDPCKADTGLSQSLRILCFYYLIIIILIIFNFIRVGVMILRNEAKTRE